MKAYLQGPNGEEVELTVTEPDPQDGTVCVHLEEKKMEEFESQLGWTSREYMVTDPWYSSWIRIVP